MTEFKRATLNLSREGSPGPESVSSLPELVDFNAEHNPEYLFGSQEIRESGKHTGFIDITFRNLQKAIHGCASELDSFFASAMLIEQIEQGQTQPVALFLESAVTVFIYFLALLYMNVPVILLSIRLSPTAITHLLRETRCNIAIVSSRTQDIIKQADPEIRQVHATSYQELLDVGQALEPKPFQRYASSDDNRLVIAHSSGSTGLPKPIFHAHRFLLGVAACHRLQPDECVDKLTASTLPLYHIYGLLPPSLSLSTGKPCCFASSCAIPSATSTTDLLKTSGASCLMTVPSILEEAMSDSDFLDSLTKLEFVVFGGGVMQPRVAEFLLSNGVNILNHWGSTETCSLTPIFKPDQRHDWHYLQLRTDIKLELKLIEDEDETNSEECRYQLMTFPFGWDKPFLTKDILKLRRGSKNVEVAIQGRKDDLLVLATGEKVNPQPLEQAISLHDGVKTAIVFGQNQVAVGIIVEPAFPFSSTVDRKQFIGLIWDTVQRQNGLLDRHARVLSKDMIIITPQEKAVPRTDKGTIRRQETYTIFQEEIDSVYEESDDNESDDFVMVSLTDPAQLVETLREFLQKCVQDRIATVATWMETDDFFEMGMDSLEAVRFARLLNCNSFKKSFPHLAGKDIGPSFVYQNPSLKSLVQTLLSHRDADRNKDKSQKLMLDLAAKYATADSSRKTVLLTGSTGYLGVHLLRQLSMGPTINKVVCLIRQNDHESLASRQNQANRARGVGLSDSSWSKIHFFPSNQLDRPLLGLSHGDYYQLTREVTHIVHSAWPMDFQRTLSSFEPHIRAVKNLVDLSVDCHRQQGSESLPRFLFTSSVAVGAFEHPGNKNTGSSQYLLEAPITSPWGSADLGYAQAKWVSERITAEAARVHKSEMHPIVARLGQISGATDAAAWNPKEHIPAIFKTSQAVGALPDLTGDFSWIPVDIAASCVLEVLFSSAPESSVFYHIENPIRQPWQPLLPVLAKMLGISRPSPLPFPEWLKAASALAQRNKEFEGIANLISFLGAEFLVLSQGGLALDTTEARKVSPSLRTCGEVEVELIERYIASWRREGFLR